jgi:hypothetical protein
MKYMGFDNVIMVTKLMTNSDTHCPYEQTHSDYIHLALSAEDMDTREGTGTVMQIGNENRINHTQDMYNYISKAC